MGDFLKGDSISMNTNLSSCTTEDIRNLEKNIREHPVFHFFENSDVGYDKNNFLSLFEDTKTLSDIAEEISAKNKHRESDKSTANRAPPLMDLMTREDLMGLSQCFKTQPQEEMTETEIKDWLEFNIQGFKYSEDEFHQMFLRMDFNRKGMISWHEFINFTMTESKEKEALDNEKLQGKPIPSNPKILRGLHRHPIKKIEFNPVVTKERVVSFDNGKYLTVSTDGVIKRWSLDMNVELTWKSEPPSLKICATYITDLICLPDVNIVCLSSSERDLRFYDITSDIFVLRVVISSMDYAGLCMWYNFQFDRNKESTLVIGDMGGNIKAIEFYSYLTHNPFKHQTGSEYTHILYSSFRKKETNNMALTEFQNIYDEWVRQVYFHSTQPYIISCSLSETKSLVIINWRESRRPKYIIPVPKGVSCFTVIESENVIVTGGIDTKLRVWPIKRANHPSEIYIGHHSQIVHVATQEEEDRIFSISSDRVIKIWGRRNKACLQTYCEKLNKIGMLNPICALYNKKTYQYIIASENIAVLKCGAPLNRNYFDGQSHLLGVTKALYNSLFKRVITVGMDSNIKIWDPWTGKLISMIEKAHAAVEHGIEVGVGISTATLDPKMVVLLTGALDGSVKMWNFNTRTCLRNMNIGAGLAVTNLIWIPERIFACGWNGAVTEWEDTTEVGDSKTWFKAHTDIILASALCWPQGVTTSSYNGELVFYKLETCQPYKRYHVGNPTKRVEAVPKGSVENKKQEENATTSDSIRPSGYSKVGVHGMCFLANRQMSPIIGTLLVSLENGEVQIWSHHPVGGFIDKFYAHHTADDYVITMTTDSKNEYLFTGHTAGYLKIWLMTNFGMPGPPQEIVMPLQRVKFPFLIKEYFPKRSQASANNQKGPLLVSSYRAHIVACTHIELIEPNQIVITCSRDKTVKLWTLGGQYIGTLGTYLPWPNIPVNGPAEIDTCRIPPDIRRTASATTLKVLTNGYAEDRKKVETEQESRLRKKLEKWVIKHKTHGEEISRPILGQHYHRASYATRVLTKPKLDMSTTPEVRIFTHMNTYQMDLIDRPKTPPLVKSSRKFRERMIKECKFDLDYNPIDEA